MVIETLQAMHITVTTLSGYTPAEKKLLAKRLNEAAASVDVASFSVSSSVKDLSMGKWDAFISELPDDGIIIP